MSLNFSSIPPKRLLQGITSSSSSFYLNNILSFDGITNVLSTDLGTQHYCCFRNDTGTQIELMEIDPTTISAGPITIVRRGLSYYGDRTTETTALKFDWSANETIVQLGTDVPQIFQWLKEYIDAASFAGGVPASTTNGGIVVEASQAEVNAFTDTKIISAVAYKLIATPAKLQATTVNKGISKLSVAPASAAEPIVVGDNDTRVASMSTTSKGISEEATQAEIEAGTGAGATGGRLSVNPSTLALSYSRFPSDTDQTQTTQDGAYAVGEANATTKKNLLAQSFIANNLSIRGAALYKKADTGTFTGTVTVSLQADSAGSPSGSNLASFAISNAAWLKIAVGEFAVKFSSEYASLTPTSTYWIVVTSSTSDNSNHPNLGINSAGGYASGAPKYKNVTDGWVAVTGQDLYFKTLNGINGKVPISDTTTNTVPMAILTYGMIDFNVAAASATFAETTVYSKQLSGGLLHSTAGLHIINFFNVNGGTTSGTGTIRIKLNGTTIATISVIAISYDSGNGGMFEAHIVNNASTSSQNYSYFYVRVGNAGTSGNGWSYAGSGTSAIDTTQPMFFEITYQSSASTVNINHISTLLEKIG